MKKAKGIIWGVIIIALGVVLGLNAFEITDINLFFDGWWTLFIIIPCTVSLFTSRNKKGNIVGILIGVILLLVCRDVLTYEMIWKVVLPVFVIAIGVKIVIKNIFSGKKLLKKNSGVKHSSAIFSGQELNYDGEVFTGASYTSVFGGIECDLRGALVKDNSVINVVSVFGGVDILLPDNINVKTSSTSIFGGVDTDEHTNNDINSTTVYINATCVFGGVDVK